MYMYCTCMCALNHVQCIYTVRSGQFDELHNVNACIHVYCTCPYAM